MQDIPIVFVRAPDCPEEEKKRVTDYAKEEKTTMIAIEGHGDTPHKGLHIEQALQHYGISPGNGEKVFS